MGHSGGRLGTRLEYVDDASPIGEKMCNFGTNKIAMYDYDAATNWHPKTREKTHPAHIGRESQKATDPESQSCQHPWTTKCNEISIACQLGPKIITG
tara:strand:+ start:544 stop:834 length:291 start_codon:yes stop_codon:yes gene_type:complete